MIYYNWYSREYIVDGRPQKDRPDGDVKCFSAEEALGNLIQRYGKVLDCGFDYDWNGFVIRFENDVKVFEYDEEFSRAAHAEKEKNRRISEVVK